MKKKKVGKNSFSILAIVTEAGTLGFTLAICLIVGVLVGHYIDTLTGTAPWGLIGFAILGAVAGFWSLYKKALRIMKSDEEQQEDKTKG